MSFLIRAIASEDLGQLYDLAKQFNLLNLPADKKILEKKIDRSMKSFAGKNKKDKSEYLFVIEDIEEKVIVGSSLIIAKHGTEEIPHFFFKILKRDHFSRDLGIGFIHQVLRFQLDTDGPTEIGGLLVEKSYRRRPEKLGKQISLVRFLYMAMYPEKFEERVLCELTPPLTEEGRSEFWEALGRRFTGLPYQEADILSQNNKEFIESLFPEDDIYLCLLGAKARLVLGRVGEATKPAQHLLENIGFQYLQEVDPFDGGPHFGCKTQEISLVKQSQQIKVAEVKDAAFKDLYMVSVRGAEFRAITTPVDLRENFVVLPARARQILNIKNNDEVFIAPFGLDENRGRN